MSQMMEQDMTFAPLGAEQDAAVLMQQQQIFGLIDTALQQVQQPSGSINDFPSIYDGKLRQLIDAVPME